MKVRAWPLYGSAGLGIEWFFEGAELWITFICWVFILNFGKEE